jgi:hypothetical protein
VTSALQKIVESKRALRRELASRPVAEKLQMLDAMREREMSIRGAASPPAVGAMAPDSERRKP